MSALTPTVKEQASQAIVGQSVLRKEDRPLLTGRASFVDDVRRPDMVHATILRSPHAHARIAGIEPAAALAMDGVLGVLTANDLPGGGPEIPMRMFPQPGMERFLQRPLAAEVVRYSGEPVAVVLAASRYLAEDAAEQIEVDYEPLRPVLDHRVAAQDASPAIHARAGSNVAARFVVENGNLEAAFAEADLVIERLIRCHRHAAVPLETRGIVAELDLALDELTVWGAAKIPHINRRILARMLGRTEESIRFVELSVGGGFGARGEFYPEDFLIPWCAIALGRPVAWTEDREEHLRSTNHSREQTHSIALALRADGTFLGLRDDLINDTGAYVRTHATVVPSMTAAMLPGPYRWNAYRCAVCHVVTNKTPAGTYRAPGRYEATLARERMVDIAARALEIDPAELRRRNLVAADEMPYATGTHTDGHPVVYDSGDYHLLLSRGLERFEYERMLRWRDSPGDGRRGIGLAMFVEKSGIARWEYARVGLRADGEITVRTGAASLGQGVQTVLAQICADELGVGYDRVTVHLVDTAFVPDGMGAFGSRATVLAGTAVSRAATALRQRILESAAERLEAAPSDLQLAGDRVIVRGTPSAAVALAELSERAQTGPALSRGDEPGLACEAYFDSEDMSFPYGLHCAAVEVDVETGRVQIRRYVVAYDVGRAVNPALIEGQIAGGLAQGAGGALLEELAYDADGQLVAGSFMDLLLPTASEAPAVDVLVTEDAPSPLTPLGLKGAGEGGATAGGAAIANAVSDALGAEVTSLPLTPQRVVELAQTGGSR
jgi:aerobic carbon-monoxide dehydrogenase large subunit